MRLAALLLIAAGMALGETPQVVRATGEAVLSIQPDQTWLKISVAATAGSAGRAAARNADRTARVIACARDIAGPTARIHSANYTLTRRFDGFVAADTVEIRLSDSRAAGRLIDAVAKLGSGGPRRRVYQRRRRECALGSAQAGNGAGARTRRGDRGGARPAGREGSLGRTAGGGGAGGGCLASHRRETQSVG